MGLFQNLVQGFAGAAGDEGTVNRIQKKKDEATALSHEELSGKTQSILSNVSALQQRRAALPPGSPEIANIDKALKENQQAFQDLYHPTKNPGALQHLGGFLKQHITGKAPAPAPASNAVTPDRMAGLQASAAGTATPEVDPWAKFSAQYKGITGKTQTRRCGNSLRGSRAASRNQKRRPLNSRINSQKRRMRRVVNTTGVSAGRRW